MRIALSHVPLLLAGLFVVGGSSVARMEHPARFLLVAIQGGRFLEVGSGVLQTGPNDCGPAALAHCLRRLGADAPYPDPECTVPLGRNGCRLDALAADAERQGWSTRVRRLATGEVGSVLPPAILHSREGHFLVLERVGTDGEVFLHDPAVGSIRHSAASWARRWTGHVLEFPRSEPWSEKASAW
ncbi:MAG: hypothetical protein DHS20C21_14490 [Gemmatimonadota bacterium]|nr:MAG: hypothetical protein DHS20C21_14490 [Gemmatimonadota bacterium]